WHHTSGGTRPAADRRDPALVVQPAMGLRPDRWPGSHRAGRRRIDLDGANLAHGPGTWLHRPDPPEIHARSKRADNEGRYRSPTAPNATCVPAWISRSGKQSSCNWAPWNCLAGRCRGGSATPWEDAWLR